MRRSRCFTGSASTQDLLEPSRLYKLGLKEEHHDRVVKCFDDLTKTGEVNIEENKATCSSIYKKQAEAAKIENKIGNMVWLAILFGILWIHAFKLFLFMININNIVVIYIFLEILLIFS